MKPNRAYLLAIALLAPGAVGIARADCDTFQGKLTDRWPGESQVALTVCPDADDPDHVTGSFRYNDPDSGWDRRSLEGDWSEDHTRLTLHDVEMLEVHAKAGWRLCTADNYDLTVDGDTITGTFDSSDCTDWGNLDLARVSVAAVAPVESAPASWPYAAAAAVFASALALLLLRRRMGVVVSSDL